MRQSRCEAEDPHPKVTGLRTYCMSQGIRFDALMGRHVRGDMHGFARKRSST